jgi:hypothetical protein
LKENLMSREKRLEIARAAYKEIKEVVDSEEHGIVSASWNKHIIVDDEGFGHEELDEKYYLKNENDKSFDASKTYCERF